MAPSVSEHEKMGIQGNVPHLPSLIMGGSFIGTRFVDSRKVQTLMPLLAVVSLAMLQGRTGNRMGGQTVARCGAVILSYRQP
jgi:hypothetical protein